jgi:undecaprenyl-diphosphatase
MDGGGYHSQTAVVSVILGIIQGLTEFLPISSSGHLAIAEYLFGFSSPSLFFEILVHLATLVAVIIFFRKEILKLRIYELFLLGIGTIPAVLVGLLLKDFIEQAFGSMLEIAIEFSITGALLLYAHKKLAAQKDEPLPEVDLKKITPLQAFIIGIWQAFAILPAISRSGATVVGALLLGIDRQTAFTFSFLLSIPAILGATVLEFSDLDSVKGLPQIVILGYTLAFLFSLIFGLISLKWFQQVVKKTQMKWFAFYCFLLSALVLLGLFFGFLK